jgi:RNA polymerase sigma-70 factor (ECF subfamily)
VFSEAYLESLLERARRNDRGAVEELLSAHRARLRTMVALRFNSRILQRVDPSDVVQEALLEAAKKLPDYLARRPMPFYLWLRRFAWEKLVHAQRFHMDAQRRSVHRELPLSLPLSDSSSLVLADRLAASCPSPSHALEQRELQAKVHLALMQLARHDQEILALLYLEQLSMQEVSEVLGIRRQVANMRHLRAVDRFRRAFHQT